MSSLQASSVGRRGVFLGTVGANERLCDEHALVRIVVDNFPQTRPGQFVQLQCRPLGEQAGAIEVQLSPDRPPQFTQAELTDKEPLLRRPLSLAAVARGHGQVELDIIYRTIGAGTRWLWQVEPGTQVSILGPLGNGFSIRAGKAHAALVAGGVGIPPMLYLAASLAEAGRGVTTFSGVRSANLMPLAIAAAAAPDKAGASSSSTRGGPSRSWPPTTDRQVSRAWSATPSPVGWTHPVRAPTTWWSTRAGPSR